MTLINAVVERNHLPQHSGKSASTSSSANTFDFEDKQPLMPPQLHTCSSQKQAQFKALTPEVPPSSCGKYACISRQDLQDSCFGAASMMTRSRFGRIVAPSPAWRDSNPALTPTPREFLSKKSTIAANNYLALKFKKARLT